jgi:hypothetical protein
MRCNTSILIPRGRGAIVFVAAVIFVILVGVTPTIVAQCRRAI